MATASNEMTMTVKVQADLSAFRQVTVDEVAKILGEHVYGDRGPVAGHPDALSVCSRAAADLCERFHILPSGT